MADVAKETDSRKVQDLFNRGFTALERGNLDYAIEMLYACVEADPSQLKAWKYLKSAEMKRFMKKKKSSLSLQLAEVSGAPAFLSAMAMHKSGKDRHAMMMAEKLLRDNPTNLRYGKLFAEAAVAAELPEVAILALETVREGNPDDATLLGMLGGYYQAVGRMRSARECFEHLCEINPNDPAMLKKLKDVMALDSISTDGWENAEKGGSFRDMLKDENEAKILEQQSKSAKSDAGVDSLIEDMKQKVEAEPNNINFRRALANFYVQKNDYGAAIEALEKAVEMNPGDPELERTLTQIQIKAYEIQIEEQRKAGNEAAVSEMEAELLQFKFDDLQSRVERYPNDFQLRYDWGVMLFENDYVNEAIQQFQLAQRSAKNRVQALYYLGRCFRKKTQYDIAIRQLDSALSELPIMDANKKKVLYELGEIYELKEEQEKAMEYFLQIYQVDISYRDVASKVEQ